MSQYAAIYTVNETQLDKDDNIIAEFQKDLPHHDFICEEMCKSWNDSKMEQFFDGILKDKILSARMKSGKTEDGESYCLINVIGRPKVRFTQKIREAIYEQISAQMSDGWGEGFFGYANIMTAPDGTRLMVE